MSNLDFAVEAFFIEVSLADGEYDSDEILQTVSDEFEVDQEELAYEVTRCENSWEPLDEDAEAEIAVTETESFGEPVWVY